MSKPTNAVRQCKSCPWRVDCVPDRDIPGYRRELHQGLTCTIASGLDLQPGAHAMACHYSKRGEEFACAGWLYNQLGIGNNLGVRLAVRFGRLPWPDVEGDQHERFEDTIPRRGRRRRKLKGLPR